MLIKPDMVENATVKYMNIFMLTSIYSAKLPHKCLVEQIKKKQYFFMQAAAIQRSSFDCWGHYAPYAHRPCLRQEALGVYCTLTCWKRSLLVKAPDF